MPTAPLFEFAKVIFEFGNPSLIEALRFSKSTRRVELICAQRIKASLIALTLVSPPSSQTPALHRHRRHAWPGNRSATPINGGVVRITGGETWGRSLRRN